MLLRKGSMILKGTDGLLFWWSLSSDFASARSWVPWSCKDSGFAPKLGHGVLAIPDVSGVGRFLTVGGLSSGRLRAGRVLLVV